MKLLILIFVFALLLPAITFAAIIGDANGDNVVNGLDFSIWKNEFLNHTGLNSDFNQNGSVEGQDFAIWKTAYLSAINSTPVPPTSTPRPTATPTSTTIGYTAAQVATHNTASNCWFIISSTVYDVTGYIVKHPGGQSAITSYCGKDATTAFNNIGHSSSAKRELATLALGPLQ